MIPTTSFSGNMIKASARIDCIAIPSTIFELGDISILFACWNLLNKNQRIAERLVITFPGNREKAFDDNIQRLLAIFEIHSLFANVEVLFLEIPKSEDIYIRHGQLYTDDLPRLGLKSGPNLQFFRTLDHLKSNHFAFFNETDVFPLRPTWLAELSESLRPTHDWVLGSHYRGQTSLGMDIVGHINGAAVYAVGNTKFQNFCSEIWEPGIEEMCKKLPDTAYDIWLRRMQYMYSVEPLLWSKLGSVRQKLFTDALARFSSTDKIANLTLSSDFEPFESLVNQGFALVHGKHFREDALRNALSYGKIVHGCSLSKIQASAILARVKVSGELRALVLPQLFPDSAHHCLSIVDKIKKIPHQVSPSPSPHAIEKPSSSNILYCTRSPLQEYSEARQSTFENSSIYAFSPYKSGSTLLFNGLELMSSPTFLNKTYHSFYDQSFAQYGNTTDWIDLDSTCLQLRKEGFVFGGFRDASAFVSNHPDTIRIPLIEDLVQYSRGSVFVFLFRDPRDCLISLYYSHLKSHSIPDSDSNYLALARKFSADYALAEYIDMTKESYRDNLDKLTFLADSARASGFRVLEFAYESVLYRQYAMFKAISNSIGRDLGSPDWQEIVRLSRDPDIGCSTPIDFIPDSEDDSKHVRKASPGDHRSKLDGRVIDSLSSYFSIFIERLQLLNPEYNYLRGPEHDS